MLANWKIWFYKNLRKKDVESAWQSVETGAMILICAIFMMQMSERVWKILHVRWLEDIRRFGAEKKGDRKLLHRRRLMIAGLGLIGSFAWQWISMLYGWL